MNVLRKIYKKFYEINPDLDIELSFWGNDTLDSFQFNFDFYNHQSVFEKKTTSNKIYKTFMICGPINKVQGDLLLKSIETVPKEERIVVVLDGSLKAHKIDGLNSKFFSLNDDIVDLTISNYPYNLDLIKEKLLQIIGKKLNG